MNETTDDDLRQLDRDLAELMGWRWVKYAMLDGRTITHLVDPAHLPGLTRKGDVEVHEAEPDADCTGTACVDVPRYSSTWPGFGLLVEECERRGWTYGMTHAKFTYASIDTAPERPSGTPFMRRSLTLPHAFALAMRDALRAAKEAQG